MDGQKQVVAVVATIDADWYYSDWTTPDRTCRSTAAKNEFCRNGSDYLE